MTKNKTAGMALSVPEDFTAALIKLMACIRPEYRIPAAIPKCKRRNKRK
jgi:hypothetical protein